VQVTDSDRHTNGLYSNSRYRIGLKMLD
jgi:hypothetical protein